MSKTPQLTSSEAEESSDLNSLMTLIDVFTNLQRIKSAADRDKEIDYQIAVAKEKLKVFGIATDDLEIH